MGLKLPVDYTKLDWRKGEIRAVRKQYIGEQDDRCYFCKRWIYGEPSADVADKDIDWGLFPPNFQKHPIHLQHNHDTNMTEGAVHMRCNAVMWQYHGT